MGTFGPEFINVKDGMNMLGSTAMGNGTIDDGPTIAAAIQRAANFGGTVYFPPGPSYLLGTSGGDSAFRVPANVTLQFAPGASLLPHEGVVVEIAGSITA